MNLHTALTTSIANDEPLRLLGQLLSDQRQIIEAIQNILESEHGWLLQFDREEWESEANDLFDLSAEMFRRFGG
jgi:hypothetical protein